MSDFAMHAYSQDLHFIVACCDAELVGKKFTEGKFVLDILASYYDGIRGDLELLNRHLARCTMATFAGPKSVAAGIEAELIHPDFVRTVDGIPHAQYMEI